MHSTIELLDRYAAAKGGVSDYRVAQLLAVHQTTVSKWRTGVKRMSEANALKIAVETGLDAIEVLASIAEERADDEEVKKVWKRVAANSAGALVAVAAAMALIATEIVPAVAGADATSMYITLNQTCIWRDTYL